jgi:transaldolase
MSSGLGTTSGRQGWPCRLRGQPHLADDTQGTIEEARRLQAALDRPHVFIKVPATLECVPGIPQLISEGISVNGTFLLGLPRYRQVAHAYIASKRLSPEVGKSSMWLPLASFLVSRIDVLVDALHGQTCRARR